MPNPRQQKHWGYCLALSEIFQQIEPGFTLNALSVLAFVAQHPGCRKQEIEDHLGLLNTTSSRVLKYLDKCGLVQRKVDPDYYRRTICFLTDKGKKLGKMLERLY